MAAGLDFAEFCRAEYRGLVRALVLLTADRGEAEELTQEAIARVHKRWDRVGVMESRFVDRQARGRGVSERLLRAAVDYARSRGVRLLEAYQVDKDERGHPDIMFFGAKSMHDRAGFREVARRKPTRPVVRRSLRPPR
ncbi:MAG TPA: GNAT family N-acetyltransferase [Actinomycetota bacterium]|nr:GNAT family N-acetyltransferase [Actinomycetota bacterium]